ncbi:Feruloyl CoA ortho-hydroxylase 1 [Citrus sinensis]|uniref:Feruloyl CoA ortho-hydroxylase 1 n=1 Tax=Citrus sinensis TaxID=2711 RepID=A0ACB8MUQ4_CITSI|nr:Feruloyl CoA ortho-hydroxylase 1 [Citrus sinensis]
MAPTNGSTVVTEGLSEKGLKSLPKQFHQPLEERFSEKRILDHVSIPLIDMSKWESPENWGFFPDCDHGVPLEVLERVKEATHRFFALPAERRGRYGSSFVPHVERALEWKDFLSLFYVSEEETSAFWPPVCKDEMLEYMRSSEVLIKRLMDVLVKGLNVKRIDEIREPMLLGSRRVNLNYYPMCPNPELTVGVGRHSDISTFTYPPPRMTIGGLHVRKDNGTDWIHVAPISGSLIINIGDALQIMSNGRYKSIEHCVIANGSQTQISVPLFVNPKPEAILCPFPEVLANGEKPLYKPVLCADYSRHFYTKAHDGKKTIDFAKISDI